jgi:hypothetical protein
LPICRLTLIMWLEEPKKCQNDKIPPSRLFIYLTFSLLVIFLVLNFIHV